MELQLGALDCFKVYTFVASFGCSVVEYSCKMSPASSYVLNDTSEKLHNWPTNLPAGIICIVLSPSGAGSYMYGTQTTTLCNTITAPADHLAPIGARWWAAAVMTVASDIICDLFSHLWFTVTFVE